MLDIARVALVAEASGEPTHQPEAAIHLAQQQLPAFDVMSPPSKLATTVRCETTSNSDSFVVHSTGIGGTAESGKVVLRKQLSQIRGPDALLTFEKSTLSVVVGPA